MPGRDTAPGFCCAIFLQPQVVSSFGETNPRCENATTGTAALRSESRPASSTERGVLLAGVRPSARGRANSDVFVHGAAGHDGAHHATLEPGLVERRVLAFRLELGGIQHPRRVEVDHDD